MSSIVAVFKTWCPHLSLTLLPLRPLSISLLLVLGVGCQGMDSYDSFRRDSSTFQVADGPVYRYPIAAHSNSEIDSEGTKRGQKFQLPQSNVVSMDLKSMDLSPRYQLPTMDLEMDSAHDHSGIKDKLPQRDVTVNMNDRDVQYLLQQLGLYGGALDGKRGPMTTAAIKAFQKSRGLTVDGVAGRKTKSELVAALKQKMSKNF